MELFPMRCYTCGKVLAGLQREYESLVSSGVPISEAMDRLGIVRECCRTRAMNPGVYVFPGTKEEYPISTRSQRVQPPTINPVNVLSQIQKEPQQMNILKPLEPITSETGLEAQMQRVQIGEQKSK